jgi:hypothetical protein
MRSGADLHRGRACPKLQNFQKKKKLKLEFYPLRLVFFFFFSLSLIWPLHFYKPGPPLLNFGLEWKKSLEGFKWKLFYII